VLLQSVARLVFSDENGTLREQLERPAAPDPLRRFLPRVVRLRGRFQEPGRGGSAREYPFGQLPRSPRSAPARAVACGNRRTRPSRPAPPRTCAVQGMSPGRARPPRVPGRRCARP
jgi:hypothetical protein